MQKWEYLLVSFVGSLEKPSWIIIWPKETIDLEWLRTKHGVRIEIGRKGIYDWVDKLYEKAEEVGVEFMRYLGSEGWEVITFEPTYRSSGQQAQVQILFKRPLVD